MIPLPRSRALWLALLLAAPSWASGQAAAEATATTARGGSPSGASAGAATAGTPEVLLLPQFAASLSPSLGPAASPVPFVPAHDPSLAQPAPALVSPADASPAPIKPAPGEGVMGRVLGASGAKAPSGAAAYLDDPEFIDMFSARAPPEAPAQEWTGKLFDGSDSEARGRILDLLRRQETVRIFVDGAPGNGHQAASVGVVRRLRQLGYKGRLEVVYEHDVKAKLGYLLPGFNPRGSNSQTLASGVSAVSFKRFDKEPSLRRRVALGISGAGSFGMHPDLAVDSLLRLQPQGWYGYYDMRVGGKTIELPDSLREMGFVYDIASPADPAAFVRKEMSASGKLARKGRPLASILGGTDRYELLPAYGLGYDGVPKLTNLLKAIRDAQVSSPDAFRGGVVIPLVSNLNAREMAELTVGPTRWDWLDAVFGFLRAMLGTQRVQLPAGPPVEIVSATDPRLRGKLQRLDRGEILIVRLGPLPPTVFDYLFSRASMPATVAGKNATNVARLIGRPFLNTIADIPEGLEKDDLVRDAHLDLGRRSEGSVSALARFLVEGMKRDSPLSRLYAPLSPGSQPLKSDKLAQGLLALHEALESQADAPGRFAAP